MILIGLAGYVCAWLQTGMPNAIAAVIKRRMIVFTAVLFPRKRTLPVRL
jgi:hypothetical protein